MSDLNIRLIVRRTLHDLWPLPRMGSVRGVFMSALTAKDKEIEALRADLSTLSEFVKKSECLRHEALNDARHSEERAETAERRVAELEDRPPTIDARSIPRFDALVTKLQRERDRIADELDTMNDNHRVMAKLLADTGRERDEARAALKPFARYSVGAIFEDEKFDYRVHVCCSMEDQPQFKHFDAARAVEQGDKP